MNVRVAMRAAATTVGTIQEATSAAARLATDPTQMAAAAMVRGLEYKNSYTQIVIIIYIYRSVDVTTIILPD